MLLAAPALLAAGFVFANSSLPDQAARRVRMLQELGLQNSLRAIKALDERKLEEDKLDSARRAEQERLEAARRGDEEKLSKQKPVQVKLPSPAETVVPPAPVPELKAVSEKPAPAVKTVVAEIKAAVPAKLVPEKPAAAEKAPRVMASLPEAKRAVLPPPASERSGVAVDLQDLSRYPVAPPPDDEDEPAAKHSAGSAVAYGKLLSTGPRDKPYVAFTFDDGPGQSTRQVLHLFAFYRAKATFFLLGDSLESYPDLAREVARAGHLLANHTWSHTNFYNLYDPEKLENEIIKTYAQIQLVTGRQTYLLRIPYGVSKGWARQSAAKAQHLLVNWTYGVDTRLEKTQEQMLAEYLANLRPGAIFLFHDGGRHKPKTIWVVERLLEECRRRGLKPVTLDRMFDIDPEKFPRPSVVSPAGRNPAYAGRAI